MHPKHGPELSQAPGSRCINFDYFAGCWFQTIGIDSVPKIIHSGQQEVTLFLLQPHASCLQPLQHLAQVVQMLLIRRTCAENVIQVNAHTRSPLQKVLHEPLKNYWSWCNSKLQSVVLKDPVCVDSDVLLGLFIQLNLKVGMGQV